MIKNSKTAALRPNFRRWLSAAAGLAIAATGAVHAAKAADTIKVGILHSLSGTMAISETTLKDVMLMLIDEQNKKGGLLGKKLEAVVVDPASNWPLFAEKARELITKDKVAVVFGCWTSVSRKSVLPVFKELNSDPVLSGAVRRRRIGAQRLLHRRRAEPAGDPCRRLPDEQGWRLSEALGAGGHRLRLSAHHQQDSRGLSEVQGRQARGYHDQLYAVRALRLADHRRRHQEVRLGGQEDGRGLHHQRRRQRSVLQGTRQPGHQGDRHPGRGVLGRRGRTRRSRHQASGRPSRRLELLQVDQDQGECRLHQEVARVHQEAEAHRPTTRWKPTTSASTCG